MNGKKIAIIVCLILLSGVIGFYLGKTNDDIASNDIQNQYDEFTESGDQTVRDTTDEEVDDSRSGKQDSFSQKDSAGSNESPRKEEKKDEIDTVEKKENQDPVIQGETVEDNYKQDVQSPNDSKEEEKKDKYELPEF